MKGLPCLRNKSTRSTEAWLDLRKDHAPSWFLDVLRCWISCRRGFLFGCGLDIFIRPETAIETRAKHCQIRPARFVGLLGAGLKESSLQETIQRKARPSATPRRSLRRCFRAEFTRGQASWTASFVVFVLLRFFFATLK